jgi:hypothetical protein
LELDRPRNPEAALERLRAECLGFFDSLPELPLYPRADDPARSKAEALLPAVEELLARCAVLRREPAVGPLAGALSEVVKAHGAALCHAADGRIRAAEEELRNAEELEPQILSSRRLWVRSDERKPPVFDPATGVSRYDPWPEPMLTVKLACPAPCQAASEFSISPRLATHELVCPKCQAPFQAYLAEARAVEIASRRGGVKRYVFKVQEPSGSLSRIEFEDPSGAEFSVAKRDLLAFLYTPKRALRGALNLSSGRLLRLQREGACFLATFTFGEGASELAAFRAFRDDYLRQRRTGIWLVRFYYWVGPGLVRVVSRRARLALAVRVLLAAAHRTLVRRGYQ